MIRIRLLAVCISIAASGCGREDAGRPSPASAGIPTEVSNPARVDDGVQVAEIAVDGAAFEPAAVGLSPGVPARLVITRTDAPTCVDSIAAPELGIETKAVSVDVPVILEFTPETGGTFTLACGMDMVTARLVVRS